MPPPPLRLWLVDDTPRWHAVTASTAAEAGGVVFEGFQSAAEAIAEFGRRAAEQSAALPDVVLMDFFLGGACGDDVAAELRRLEPPGRRCAILGHSSEARCSRRIHERCGDGVLRKHADGGGRNPSLAAWLEAWRARRR